MHVTHLAAPEIVVTPAEREGIRSIASGLTGARADRLSAGGLLSAAVAAAGLPERLRREFVAFRRWSTGSGTMVVRGLPTAPDLPPTPASGRCYADGRTSLSENLLAMLLSQLGDPIAYADEKGGEIVQEVCPVRGHEQRQENSGSGYLEFHTENGFHPYKADFLALLCLRPDHDRTVRTITASVRTLLPRLSDDTVAALRRRAFRIRPSSSFGDVGPVSDLEPTAVLAGSPDEPDLIVDCNAMVAEDPEGERALAEVRELLPEVSDAVALDAGDLLVIDNRVAAHARSSWQPRYDGQDRWLQRMSVVCDFRPSRVVRPPGEHRCLPLTAVLNPAVHA